MCGSGARWCARADAIFDVVGMHVLDVEVVLPLGHAQHGITLVLAQPVHEEVVRKPELADPRRWKMKHDRNFEETLVGIPSCTELRALGGHVQN